MVLNQHEDRMTTHLLSWETHSARWSSLEPILFAIRAQDQVSVPGYNGHNAGLLLVWLFTIGDGDMRCRGDRPGPFICLLP